MNHKPSAMWLTVNRDCNFRCKWCYAQGTGFNGKEMSLDLACRLTQIAKDAGVKRILLIGGEPTLWPQLKPYTKFAKSLGLIVSMVTNGFAFGTDRFWQDYHGEPCDAHGVSLKAGSREQLIDLTGVSRFDTLMEGVRRLNSINPSFVSIVYGPDYYSNLLDMARLAMESGARGFSIDFCRGFVENGEINDGFSGVMSENARTIVENYDALHEITGGKLSITLSMPFCLFPDEFINKLIERRQITSICHVVKRNGLVLDVDGKILMCNALFNFPIGELDKDYHDGHSLLAHLNSPKLSAYYDRMASLPSIKCDGCEWYPQCGGGCPLHWATLKPDEAIPGTSKHQQKGGEING